MSRPSKYNATPCYADAAPRKNCITVHGGIAVSSAASPNKGVGGLLFRGKQGAYRRRLNTCQLLYLLYRNRAHTLCTPDGPEPPGCLIPGPDGAAGGGLDGGT